MHNGTNVVLLGAMPQEVEAYTRKISEGRWHNCSVYADITGVGKTSAAAKTQQMIGRYNPDIIIFTGVAGALDSRLRIGDICVGIAAIDADMDLRQWDSGYLRGEQMFSRDRLYYSDNGLVEIVRSTPGADIIDVYIATGSAFLDVMGKKRFLEEINPGLSAVIGSATMQPNVYDMESSVVLQTAKSSGIPAVVIKAISDVMEGDAQMDFNRFIEGAVNDYFHIIEYTLMTYKR